MSKFYRLGALLICAQLAFGVQVNAAPIHDAALDGDLEQLKQLLDEGADVNEPDDAGTPLQWALFVGQVEVVRLAHGANPGFATHDGITALHVAAKLGRLEIARRLVAQGADVNAITAAGKPPIHLAVLGKHAALAAYLREQGAVPGEVAPIADLLSSANLAEGEQEAEYYCSGCHKFEDGKNYYGPHLWNVVGRSKGAVGNFAYSPAFSELEGVWAFEDLNAFLARPADLIPGTKMELIGIVEPQKRANLIAYLRTLSDAPVPLP